MLIHFFVLIFKKSGVLSGIAPQSRGFAPSAYHIRRKTAPDALRLQIDNISPR